MLGKILMHEMRLIFCILSKNNELCYTYNALVLGNISIFSEYHDISLDKILYYLISKYCILIFIVFIIFTYVKNEAYNLDMNSRVITPMRLKYQAVTFS